MAAFKEFSLKKFGCTGLEKRKAGPAILNEPDDFIKIVYLKAGGSVKIDFEQFNLEQDAFFFISPGQFYEFSATCRGTMLYYNRDFYCIQIHDKEVACDGILFRNVYEIPVVWLTASQSSILESLITETESEMRTDDSGTEEMLRIILKQIIIKCTRIWKLQHQVKVAGAKPEVEFSRKFSQLIDAHYTERHTVADYADILNITAKSLNKRIMQYGRETPNDLIKNRIILEAKRLLAHTTLNIKEISYKLGYEDSSYFIRFFTKNTGNSPQKFRLSYLNT